MAINPQAVRGPVTAVPVVAGKGVRFVEDVENNRVVAEADETVLWDGNGTALVTETLSESIYNFEMLRIYLSAGTGSGGTQVAVIAITSGQNYLSCGYSVCEKNTYVFYTFTCNATISNNGTTLTVPQQGNGFAVLSDKSIQRFTNNSSHGGILKIVGVNRVSA